MDPSVHWILRGALALLFGAAAFHKLRDRKRFEGTLRDYRVLPEPFVPPSSGLIPLLEGSIAVGLLLPAWASLAAWAASALLVAYSAGIALNLARGRRHIDCGCLGPRGREPISHALVARNALLVAACLALATLPAGGRALAWPDAVSIAGGIAVVALLFYAAQVVLAQASREPQLGRTQ